MECAIDKAWVEVKLHSTCTERQRAWLQLKFVRGLAYSLAAFSVLLFAPGALGQSLGDASISLDKLRPTQSAELSTGLPEPVFTSDNSGASPSGDAQNFFPVIDAVRHQEVKSFQWGSALRQSFYFLGIEHGVRLAFDPPSRTAFRGRFWSDYIDSIQQIRGWDDGNPTFINYIGHPLQGSVAGFIQVQNDPAARALRFGSSRAYWNSRLKAMVWSAAYSTYFEIGFPMSEAAWGNLGVDKHRRTQQGAVDLVVTPTLGTCWLVTEDLVDQYVIFRLENTFSSRHGKALIRSLLNPTRSFSNLLRFKVPWHRDARS